MHKAFKDTVAVLLKDWNWQVARNKPYVSHLIYTEDRSLRRDMRVSQFVGKVKFKFKIGEGCYPQKGPTAPRFCISYRENKRKPVGPRVVWIARQDGWNGFKIYRDNITVGYVGIEELFLDPLNITDTDLDFVKVLYPELLDIVPKLAEGFGGIEPVLRERFCG